MPKIMLDAGHTGRKWNKGALAGYYESAVMWELQEALADALTARGFAVGRTRGTIDTQLEVTRRGKKAAGCDFFLSLHSNACDDPAVRRVSAIYQTPDTDGDWDETSRKGAEALAKAAALTMGVTYKTYAKTAGGDRDGDGKKDDNYYGVLHGARMVKVPGVILEHSFHTNPESCRWLLDPENRRRLAAAEADALATLFGLDKAAKPKTPDWRTVTPKNGLNVRTGPGIENKKTGALKKGTLVEVAEESGNWARITSPKTGWVCSDYLSAER